MSLSTFYLEYGRHVVRTRPQAIPLAIITMRKFIDGFPFLSHMSMGLRLAALWDAGSAIKAKIFILTGLFDFCP